MPASLSSLDNLPALVPDDRGYSFAGSFLLALALLLFVSCEKPDPTGGTGLIPENDQLFAWRTDTLTLLVQSETEDSLRTDELSVSLLGAYLDPVFGMSRAWAVSQLRLSTSSVDFPNSYEVDSVVLTVQLEGYLYGRQGKPYFLVHEILDELALDETYYSNKNLNVYPDNLMLDGSERQHLSVPPNATNSPFFPALRLPLDISLAQRLMSPADPSVLNSDDSFRAFFKGLAVSTMAEPGSGVFNADLVDPASKLTIYYRDLDGPEPDTTSYAFNITSDCARFTRFEHNYLGTPLQGVESVPVPGQEQCFVQAGSGLKVRLDMPYIQNLNSFEGRTINAAELIVPFETDSRLLPQQQLVLLYRDQEGEMRVLPDQLSQTIGGLGDFAKNEYRFRIDRYIQQVLNGNIQPDGLYLYSTRGGITVNRVICNGPEFSTEDPTRNMRLLVTFTSD